MILYIKKCFDNAPDLGYLTGKLTWNLSTADINMGTSFYIHS